ncbi:MAG: phage tail sheath subtilisin-like domain-containing protein [Roseomonas sp.]|nr:phage tail sheath subtilisin-like domain-containing protein [Roseomonas sp.]
MPEYLAPGVYVEEVSFRAKSIEGVGTTTTGFIGPARFGPVTVDPDVITSLEEFERIYGDGAPLVYADGTESPNFLWHAARAFFAEQGRRLYVTRVFRPNTSTGSYPPANFNTPLVTGRYEHGHGIGTELRFVDMALDASPPLPSKVTMVGLGIRSRFPGAQGNLRVRITLRSRANLLGRSADPTTGASRFTFGALAENDLVWLYERPTAGMAKPPPPEGTFCLARRDSVTGEWLFDNGPASPPGAVPLSALLSGDGSSAELRVVTLSLTLRTKEGRDLGTWTDLAPDPGHRLAGLPDNLFDTFADEPASLAQSRSLPIVVTRNAAQTPNGLTTLAALFGATPTDHLRPNQIERTREIGPGARLARGVAVEGDLEGGHDGLRPGAREYEGRADDTLGYRTGLKQLESIEDIAIVAAPGSTWRYASFTDNADAITRLLIGHAERMRYRIAVLDSAEKHTIAEVRNFRARLDSKYAALYYPWVTVLDPVTRAEINLPPSGFVCGIYARNDITRAVWKAPANEVVTLANGFETLLNKAQQEVLNPLGINCFRYFEGRGYRLWGARTISSDPEWKYVNLRRYFAYLERSIDIGTQWAVFEPNGKALWDNVRRTVEDFLLNEWMQGALLGDKPEKAFFVRCGFPSTMTQNDLDNGRLVCLVGVAALRPAEFVIFRIGQWTADQRPPG